MNFVMDRERAAELARVVDPKPKHCYANSVLALALFGMQTDAHYVEGLLRIFDQLWTPHGWIEQANRIVDVTLSDRAPADYHAVFYYTRREVLGWAGRTLPIFDNHRAMREQMWRAEWDLLERRNLEAIK